MNIRTIHNLVFYLEQDYFVAIVSNHPFFWLRFFNYIVDFKRVTVNPLIRLQQGKALKILQTMQVNGHDPQKIAVHLVDQPEQMTQINIPYFKHPGFCWPQNKKPDTINTVRAGWCFFAGNADPALYNNSQFEKKYGIPNRHKLCQYLRTRDDALTYGFFDGHNKGHAKRIFVHTLADNNLGGKYAGYLNEFDFMICGPGVTMPLCHNIIEAMEFGCIPIFSYPEWLPNGLKHDFNCFVFATLQELNDVLAYIKGLSAEYIDKIRQQLLLYYQTHFSNFKINLDQIDKIVLLNENKQMMD